MVLGDACTRNCKFCAVNKRKPSAIDWDEPGRVAEAVTKLNLSYVVITSPTRDDISDGGAEIFCRTVEEVKKNSDSRKVEVLIPDFSGKEESFQN